MFNRLHEVAKPLGYLRIETLLRFPPARPYRMEAKSQAKRLIILTLGKTCNSHWKARSDQGSGLLLYLPELMHSTTSCALCNLSSSHCTSPATFKSINVEAQRIPCFREDELPNNISLASGPYLLAKSFTFGTRNTAVVALNAPSPQDLIY